jgi:hypothetical protein
MAFTAETAETAETTNGYWRSGASFGAEPDQRAHRRLAGGIAHAAAQLVFYRLG